MSNWVWLIIPFSVILTMLFAAIVRYREKKTMDRIGKMLDDAIKGSFTENAFTESRLSALESRFADFLSQSAISAKNVAAERDSVEALVADISHQTKTPVTNLMLYSELLSETDLPDETRSTVMSIYRQAEHLGFLIDSLVKLSRLENGIMRLSPQCEQLQPMMEKLCERFLPAAEEKGITLEFRNTELSADFDAKWTSEALGNILDNAVKYTDNGSITVSVYDYPMFVRIDIADTGIGIAEQEQAKIFSRFFRSENVRESEGVGIGLYLAREVITGEGGYIKVSSRFGHGSTFSVFLPK